MTMDVSLDVALTLAEFFQTTIEAIFTPGI